MINIRNIRDIYIEWPTCPHDKYDPQRGYNPEGESVAEDDSDHSDHEEAQAEEKTGAWGGGLW